MVGNVRRCGSCLAAIYPGSDHSEEKCRSKLSLLDNLQEALDSNVKEQMAAETLRDLVASSGSETVELKTVTGKKITVNVGAENPEIVGFATHDDIKKMKIKHNLSDG